MRRADTTLALLAECFETWAGCPRVVLADRMGCLKGGVVANVVVPTADYVRFAAITGSGRTSARPATRSRRASWRTWSATPSPTWWSRRAPRRAVPRRGERRRRGVVRRGQRRGALGDLRGARRAPDAERELLAPLPSLRREIGAAVTRKVDRLSCVRFGSARYSVPTRLIGNTVLISVLQNRVQVLEPFTGEIVADHALVAPGETSIVDEHYGSTLLPHQGRLRLGATSGGNSRGGVSLCWRSGSGSVSGMVITSALSASS